MPLGPNLYTHMHLRDTCSAARSAMRTEAADDANGGGRRNFVGSVSFMSPYPPTHSIVHCDCRLALLVGASMSE